MSKLKDAMPLATVMIMLGALFTWALYRFIYQGLTDVLIEFDITGNYLQNLIILAVVGGLLYWKGKKLSDVIK